MEEINPHLKWNWRRKKRIMRERSRELVAKGYFEDCNYHPCRATDIHPYFTSNPRTLYDADVDGVSLVTGRGTSCSMYHCAPLPLTREEAEERAAFWKENGEMEYMLKYIYPPSMHDEVRRVYQERDRQG